MEPLSIQRLHQQKDGDSQGIGPTLDQLSHGIVTMLVLGSSQTQRTSQYQNPGADTSNLPGGEDPITTGQAGGPAWSCVRLSGFTKPGISTVWPGCRSFAPGNGGADSAQMLAGASAGRNHLDRDTREEAPRLNQGRSQECVQRGASK